MKTSQSGLNYEGQTITLAKAEEIFKADIAAFEKVVTKHVTYPINQW